MANVAWQVVIVGLIALILGSGVASATTYTVCVSGCDYTTIQAAVTAASSYDTVYVWNGTYTENIDVATANLTIEGEGRDVVTVEALSSSDHVFEVTADYVNISGFTVSGATGTNPFVYRSGIFLSNVQYCNISSNYASNDVAGIQIRNSNNITVTNNTMLDDTRGIHLYYSNNNSLISNTATNNDHSIYIDNSNNNSLISNTVSDCSHGIYLQISNNNSLTSNTMSNNEYGIHIYASNNNSLIDNLMANNRNGLHQIYSDDNIFIDNTMLNNLNTLLCFQTDLQEGTIGTQKDFNFTMRDINNNDCPTCAYEVDLYPDEADLQYSPNGESPAPIEGNFTPTRKGIYSLRINVTDSSGNSEIRKYIYLINTTAEDTVNYYFRSVKATHGQPTTYGTDNDAGSLLFDQPTSEENVSCAAYIGLSVDVLPEYLFGTFKEINYSIWYKTTIDGYTGIQRVSTVNPNTDYNTVVTTTPKIFNTFNFSVDWANDFFWSWYWLAIKLNGGGIEIYSSDPDNPDDPPTSIANITYSYSTTPAIKAISNEDILLLSATSPATDNTSASIVLDGTGTTNLTVQMPNTALTYTATYDGSPCNDANCSFTQSSGELNFSLTLGSEHTIEITEEGGIQLTASANEYYQFNNWSTDQTFAQIAANVTNDICMSWYNHTSGLHDAYYVGRTYNQNAMIPYNCSVMGFFDAETIIDVTERVSVAFTADCWQYGFLPGSSEMGLPEIIASMDADGAETWAAYRWDGSTWNASGNVTPKQGILWYTNYTGVWTP